MKTCDGLKHNHMHDGKACGPWKRNAGSGNFTRMERDADAVILRAAVAGTIEEAVEKVSNRVAGDLIGQLRSSGIAFHRVGHVKHDERVNTRQGRGLLEVVEHSWHPKLNLRPVDDGQGHCVINTEMEFTIAKGLDPDTARLICWAVNNLPKLLDRYEDLP